MFIFEFIILLFIKKNYKNYHKYFDIGFARSQKKYMHII